MSRRQLTGTFDTAFLAQAFDASGDCIKLLAPEGTLLAINVAGAAALGFANPSEPIGRNWFDFLDPAERPQAEEAVRAACAGQRATLRCRSHHGPSPQWWVSTVVLAEGRKKSEPRLLVVSKDVTEQFLTERALERASQLKEALIRATSEIVWHVDFSTGVTTRLGYHEFTGRHDDPHDLDGWLGDVHPDDRLRAKEAADAADRDCSVLLIEYRLLHRDGDWRWVEDHATPVKDETGAVTDWIGIITDIHDRKLAEQSVLKNVEHLRLAVMATGLGTWDVDLLTGERTWSAKFRELMRFPPDHVPARADFFTRVHPDDRERVDREFRAIGGPENRVCITTFRFLYPDGDTRWMEAHLRLSLDNAGRPVRRVGTLQDITDRKEAEHETWLLAHTDTLTGIANRALFQKRLDAAADQAQSSRGRLALILIDLDRFKEVNDSLGHDAGDEMLRIVADRIQSKSPHGTTVARLGGDEFGIILPDAPDRELPSIVDDILQALAAPVPYQGLDVDCSASLGWAVYPDHCQSPASVLKTADIALYAAKTAGRGRALCFAPAMQEELERRVTVLRCAREALVRDAVMPFYQPKVCLQTGRVVGFEALLRWTDGANLRSPGEIQDALEDPELSIRIGARMFDRILDDAVRWSADQIPFGHVGLNVATPEFVGGALRQRILNGLDRTGILPSQIEIEVTERVLLDTGTDDIAVTLQTLNDIGVPIALDDFGTGFASLTHLTLFPVSWVKIDRSFISNLGKVKSAAAIVEAVVKLAHSLNIRVSGEGVEVAEHLAFLKAVGCDLGQGYLFAKPMPASRVPSFLARWDRSTVGLSTAGSPPGSGPVARRVLAG